MKRIISWSGGKDSTATIILAHELRIPIDLIIISLMYFDKKRGIYAESAKHLKWVLEYAKPLFESWGYKVEIVSSDKDYLYYFFKKRQKSEKHPENIGKYYGFVMGGACVMQQEKVKPIKQYLRPLKKQYEVIEYVGICSDELERLERVHNRKNQFSLLEQKNKTQADAKRICSDYGLLSPTYESGKKRGGCWFCPNQHISELAELKQTEPDKWHELKLLSKVENTVASGFRYGETFDEIEAQVDYYIENPPAEQLSFF